MTFYAVWGGGYCAPCCAVPDSPTALDRIHNGLGKAKLDARSDSYRLSGFQSVHRLPWGAHVCQLYRTPEDLADTLVPYFTAGLKSNEYCLWITGALLDARDARALLRQVVPELEAYLGKGQLDILDISEWYGPGASFNADDVLDGWIDRAQHAQRRGFDGLRLTGDTHWAERANWPEFMAYEGRVSKVFGDHPILGLCTYCLERCSALEVVDVLHQHDFALVPRQGAWEILEPTSSRARRTGKRIKTDCRDSVPAHSSGQRANTPMQGRDRRAERRAPSPEQPLRGRDEFLAVLAHELRGPLAPIGSAAQLIRARARSDDTLIKASEVLDRQVAHLSRLVGDLLDTARMSLDTLTLQKETLDLGSVLAQAVEAMQPQIGSREQVLAFERPGEKLRIQADPTRLQQVFRNLLDNASKYTPAGGRIELAARREGDDAVIRVKDSGIGIPGSMLGVIFDVFTQVDPISNRATGGLGLGLSLVKKFVEMHGGSVEANSPGPGLGSEFSVRLPLHELSAQAPVEASSATGRASPGDSAALQLLGSR